METHADPLPVDDMGRFAPRFPYHVVWLTTNACNTRCVHCSSNAEKRRPNELSTAEATAMLTQLASVGVFDMAFSGGEPLARRDIYALVAHAADCRIRVGLGSNGSTVNPAVADRLRSAGLHRLQISIDGVEATHDLARRWRGLYAKSVRAIQAGLEAGLRVHVCFTAHRLNHTELDRVIDHCAEWGVHAFNLSRFIPTGRGTRALDLTPSEWRDVTSVFERRRRELGTHMVFSTHLAQQVLANPALTCAPGFVGSQAGLGQACIGPEGGVSPCVMLPLIVGNIRERSFAEIWTQSPALDALRDRSLLEGRCGTCELRAKCGGCRGVAYAYTGSVLASDPRCWRDAAAA